jgi:hypothetical protein
MISSDNDRLREKASPIQLNMRRRAFHSSSGASARIGFVVNGAEVSLATNSVHLADHALHGFSDRALRGWGPEAEMNSATPRHRIARQIGYPTSRSK